MNYLMSFMHHVLMSFPFHRRLENNFHCQHPCACASVQGASVFNLERLLSMVYICSGGHIYRDNGLTTF